MQWQSSLSPSQAVSELIKQEALLDCAIAMLGYGSNIPEIRQAQTLLENWKMHFESLVDELSPLLCPTPDTKDGNVTLNTLDPLSQLGIVEQPRLSEYQLP